MRRLLWMACLLAVFRAHAYPTGAPPVLPDEQPAPATLIFDVRPSGEVYVDGKSMGMTPPMRQLRLPAGKVRLELRSGKAAHVREVRLKAGEVTRISHDFRESPRDKGR
jgi:serine/threonine-protein kinase